MNNIIALTALIKKEVKLCHNIIIEEYCEIGNNCFIGNNVVMRPYTIIGNNSLIGHGCVFEGQTIIGKEVHIMPQCHITSYTEIGDDVFIGPCVITCNTRKILYKRKNNPKKFKGPIIERGVRIGGGAILTPEIIIGENSYILGGSLVVKDVPPKKIVGGVPARIISNVPENEII